MSDEKIMPTSSENSQSDSDVSQHSLEPDHLSSLHVRYNLNPSHMKTSNKIGNESLCMWNSCGSSFASLDSLAAHVGEVHAVSSPGRLYYCGWEGCGRNNKAFNARYKMLVHVRTHTNEKPHQCWQCNKSFSRAENLKIHSRSHSGEKPYTCPVPGCTKAYSNSSDRFKHTRTHQVDKPYKCKVHGCPKKYTDPSSLRKHVKTYKHFVNENVNVDSVDSHNQCNSDCDCPLCSKNNLLLLDIRADKCWNKLHPTKLFTPYDLSRDKIDVDMPLDLSISRKVNNIL